MASGAIEMSFELQDVNGDITIELPEEATAGAILTGFDGALPVPEDGTPAGRQRQLHRYRKRQRRWPK